MRKKYKAARFVAVSLIMVSLGYSLYLAWVLMEQTNNLLLAVTVGVICAIAPLVFLFFSGKPNQALLSEGD